VIHKTEKQNKIRLGAKIGYATANCNFQNEEIIGNAEQIDSDELVPVIVHHLMEAKISQISLLPYFSYNFFDNFVANVGLNLGYIIKSTYKQREEIVSPDYVEYVNVGKVKNKYDDQKINDLNKLQLGLTIGLGYDFSIGNLFIISPEIQYNFPFTSISNADYYDIYRERIPNKKVD